MNTTPSALNFVDGRMFLSDLTPPPHPSLGVAFPGSPDDYHYIIGGGMGAARISASWKTPIQVIADRCSALKSLGIMPLLTLECNDQQKTKSFSHGITNQVPKSMTQWRMFVRDVVNATDAVYQVVNEWNGPENPAGGWLGTDLELIDFVVQTAEEAGGRVWMGGITPGDLDALVLNRGLADYEVCRAPGDCFSPAYYQRPEVTENIAKKLAILEGVFDSVDGLDLHLYGPTDRTPVRVQAIRNEGWTKPLMSAECGGPSLNYGEYSGEEHFMSACELMLDILASGLQAGLWFRLAEGPGGSYQNSKVPLADSSGNPKPGYWAMKFLAKALEGANSVTKDGTQYTTDNGRIIVWGSGTVDVPVGEAWQITNPLTGEYEVYDITSPTTAPLSQWPAVAGM